MGELRLLYIFLSYLYFQLAYQNSKSEDSIVKQIEELLASLRLTVSTEKQTTEAINFTTTTTVAAWKTVTQNTEKLNKVYLATTKTQLVKTDPPEYSKMRQLHPELRIRMATARHLQRRYKVDHISIEDIFIAVKTTYKNENTRLPIILKTWFELAKDQAWFFTDKDNETLQEVTNGHMVNTGCKSSSDRTSLCCKTSAEIVRFLRTKQKWLCLLEDDSYMNIPRLVEVLQAYNHLEDWYLGKNSIQKPIKRTLIKFPGKRKVQASFWYAIGSAGICLSKHLAERLSPFVSGKKFMSQCERIMSEPDVTLGFIIEHILKSNLTIVPEFHSHVEQMTMFEEDIMPDQITFSYSQTKFENETLWNVVAVPVWIRNDPTRILSLHCFFHPKADYCQKERQ